MAAGSVTVTADVYPDFNVAKYTILWESDASGDVNGVQTSLTGIRGGTLSQIKFMPSGGPTIPDDLYDVTLMDNSIDFLEGAGANLSSTVTTVIRPTAPLFYDGSFFFDLVVTNGGAVAFGTIKLWFTL